MLPTAQTRSIILSDDPHTYRASELSTRFNRLYGRVDDLMPEASSLQIVVIGGDVSGAAAFGFAALSPRHRYGVTALEVNTRAFEVGQHNTRGYNVSWHDLGYMQKPPANSWPDALCRLVREGKPPSMTADILFFGERLTTLPTAECAQALQAARGMLAADGQMLMPLPLDQHDRLIAFSADNGLKLTHARPMPDPFGRKQAWQMARFEAVRPN